MDISLLQGLIGVGDLLPVLDSIKQQRTRTKATSVVNGVTCQASGAKSTIRSHDSPLLPVTYPWHKESPIDRAKSLLHGLGVNDTVVW